MPQSRDCVHGPRRSHADNEHDLENDRPMVSATVKVAVAGNYNKERCTRCGRRVTNWPAATLSIVTVTDKNQRRKGLRLNHAANQAGIGSPTSTGTISIAAPCALTWRKEASGRAQAKQVTLKARAPLLEKLTNAAGGGLTAIAIC